MSTRLDEATEFVMATLDIFWADTADMKCDGYIVMGVGGEGVMVQFIGPSKPKTAVVVDLFRAMASAIEDGRYVIR
jgi:hypothetical protein